MRQVKSWHTTIVIVMAKCYLISVITHVSHCGLKLTNRTNLPLMLPLPWSLSLLAVEGHIAPTTFRSINAIEPRLETDIKR